MFRHLDKLFTKGDVFRRGWLGIRSAVRGDKADKTTPTNHAYPYFYHLSSTGTHFLSDCSAKNFNLIGVTDLSGELACHRLP
jgi:hypothetical protein